VSCIYGNQNNKKPALTERKWPMHQKKICGPVRKLVYAVRIR